MANEKHPPGSHSTRRRRPPTVIDLQASEVPPEAPAQEAPVHAPAQDAPVEAATAAEPSAPPVSDPEPKPEEAFIPTPPVTPAAAAFEKASYEPPPPPEPPRAEPPPPPPDPPRASAGPPEGGWRLPAAGIAGMAGGLVVALLFWLAGAFSPAPDTAAVVNPKLASIEKQLNDIAARPMPASVDPKALEEIAARLGRLESAQAAPRAPVTDPVVLGRLNAAENATKSLADNMAAMSRRADAIDAAIRDTNGKIEKLTAALTAVQNTAREAAAGSDRASRLAVVASALRNAVEHGDPFIAELAIVKPLAPDAGAIALLEPFAAAGVPDNAALGQELAAIVRPLLQAAREPAREGNFIDRLQANAKQLVRVRPVDEEPRGDDRGAILARVEQRASQGNIAGATAELAKLSPEARAPAQAAIQAWIAKADARNKALEAGRRLAADAVAALKAAP
jgi:hypothetical protein